MGVEKVKRPLLGIRGFLDGVEAASTGAELSVYGLSTITTSSEGKTYTLPAPTVGVGKVIYGLSIATSSQAGGSTAKDSLVLISGATGSTGVTFDGSNRKATFSETGDYLTLAGASTTRWAVLGQSTGVTLGTT